MNDAIQNAGDLAMTQAMGPSPMSRFANKGAGGAGRSVDAAAKDFEGMFLAQMLQPMFDTVGVDPLFGGGHGEEAMRGFLVQEYGKALAKSSHFGIADAVRAEMIRAQQKSHPGTTAISTSGDQNVIGSVQ